MDTSNYTPRFSSFLERIRVTYKSLSPERVLLVWMLLVLACFFLFASLVVYNERFLVTTPAYQGEIHEGILGTTRFINPVLATSDQDKDLTTLIYAGLMKRDAQGNVVPDMAESVIESDDHLHYDVVLKSSAEFHDGKSVTSDDIIYTVALIQDANIKSPHAIEWEGVTIQKQSDREFTISLKKSYPQFINTLTLGILPKHVWKNLSDDQITLSDYNIHAIGSGPYKIDSITTNSGIPNTFTLTAFKQYTLGRPYIDTLVISTYQNEKYLLQAFKNGDITRIHGISPDTVGTLSLAISSIITSLLPRTFTVYFNPNKANTLSNKDVRMALNLAIDKQAIVTTVLHNYGKVINTPYPFDEDVAVSLYDPEQAKELLLKRKTPKTASSTLSLTLATANTDEMKKVAAMIKNYWEAIGVTTTIEVYEVSDLNQSVIKDRNFQALLFGSITEDPSQLYAFWDSSQRTYPGLNISGYVSNKLDTNLQVLRSSEDELARINAYEAVKKEFEEEVPGIFLFAPSLIYVTKDPAHTVLPRYSFDNASRFTLVEEWYRYTEKVWPKTYYKKILQTLENIIH
jgi:peptide/nickel transport system substrate-binding protein